MNTITIIAILTLAPIFFQIIFGSLLVANKLNWNFRNVCIANVLAQLLFGFLLLQNVHEDLNKNGNQKCALPMFAMSFGVIAILVILLIIISIQTAIKVLRRKRSSNQ